MYTHSYFLNEEGHGRRVLYIAGHPGEYGIPDSYFHMKSPVLKKAVRNAKSGKPVVHITDWYADNGSIMAMVILDRSPIDRRYGIERGVVVAPGMYEFPFRNVVEQKDALGSAMAVFHYKQEFKRYHCSAGK